METGRPKGLDPDTAAMIKALKSSKTFTSLVKKSGFPLDRLQELPVNEKQHAIRQGLLRLLRAENVVKDLKNPDDDPERAYAPFRAASQLSDALKSADPDPVIQKLLDEWSLEKINDELRRYTEMFDSIRELRGSPSLPRICSLLGDALYLRNKALIMENGQMNRLTIRSLDEVAPRLRQLMDAAERGRAKWDREGKTGSA